MILARATTGNVSWPASRVVVAPWIGPQVHGWGVGVGSEDASLPALAEAVERHATGTCYEEQLTWSSAEALDGRALDLASIPRCSDSEMSNPHCSLNLPSKKEPIRWVKGLSLHDGNGIYIPAVMVYSNAGWRGAQERFWLPISTGCAAHSSYEEAVLSALCEVAERDAISLVWLQKLPLPRIRIDRDLDPAASEYWNICQRSSADIDYHLFDATTDVRLPTVYGIQVSRHHPFARTIVACATALRMDNAIAKVIKDLVSTKRAFLHDRPLPHDPAAFRGLLDGATYMGRPEHASAFDFLLESTQHVSLRGLSSAERPLDTLSQVLDHLRTLGMQALAVDLTTDEALRAGLRVVRVIVPELQPLSLHSAVQYRAHPRLYNAPARMGYIPNDEMHLNTYPQPFA